MMGSPQVLFVCPDWGSNSDLANFSRSLLHACCKFSQVNIDCWVLSLRPLREGRTDPLLPNDHHLSARVQSATEQRGLRRRYLKDAGRLFCHVKDVLPGPTHIVSVVPDGAPLALRIKQLFYSDRTRRREAQVVLLQPYTPGEMMRRGRMSPEQQQQLVHAASRWVQAADTVFSVGHDIFNTYSDLFRQLPPIDHRQVLPSSGNNLHLTPADLKDFIIYLSVNVVLSIAPDIIYPKADVGHVLTRHKISAIEKETAAGVQKALKEFWFMTQHGQIWNTGIRVGYRSTNYEVLSPRSGESRRDLYLRRQEAASSLYGDESKGDMRLISADSAHMSLRPVYTEDKPLQALMDSIEKLGIVMLKVDSKDLSLLCHAPNRKIIQDLVSQAQDGSLSTMFQRLLGPHVLRHVRRPEVEAVVLRAWVQAQVLNESKRRLLSRS